MPTKVRYRVLGMMVLLGAITYLDRVCISVTAPDMMRDLGLSKVQMSFVFSAFTLAYVIFELPTGAWGDRVGTRRVLTRIVSWWSVFTATTGAAFSYTSLLVIRFLFGAGEAGAWPNVGITFSRWFPRKDRGTIQGIFFSGAHLSAGLTPLLVVVLLRYFHWRALFALFGSIGFVWVVVWYAWFRDRPADHRAVNDLERTLIEDGGATAISAPGSHGHARVTQLLTDRSVIFLCLQYFTQTYGFYLFITWLPTYLQNARGFSSVTLGVVAGLPNLLSAFSDLAGGVTSDRLVKRFGPRVGRAGVGAASLAIAGVFMILGTAAANPITAIVLISIAGAASTFLLGAAWGTVLDIGGRDTGVVGATMNTVGNIGGFLSPIVVGTIVQYTGNWSAPLYLTGGLYLFGAACWVFVDPARQVGRAA